MKFLPALLLLALCSDLSFARLITDQAQNDISSAIRSNCSPKPEVEFTSAFGQTQYLAKWLMKSHIWQFKVYEPQDLAQNIHMDENRISAWRSMATGVFLDQVFVHGTDLR